MIEQQNGKFFVQYEVALPWYGTNGDFIENNYIIDHQLFPYGLNYKIMRPTVCL